MSDDVYLGEIRVFAFPYEIEGWRMCNGQMLSIEENSFLYGLIGTTFGGDGKNKFALPDMPHVYTHLFAQVYKRGVKNALLCAVRAKARIGVCLHPSLKALCLYTSSHSARNWACGAGLCVLF
ncbi:MAG TPA: tail fiber protein [Candidatus Brocadiaceae bacterium]|nr:tail fiber protein [Candidatus Brocadiaceae bacterium]